MQGGDDAAAERPGAPPDSPRGEADGDAEAEAVLSPCGRGPMSPRLFAEVEAVAVGWMLDFACHALCRHFREGSTCAFERSRDAAQAIINGLPNIATHQIKTVHLCQFLIRIAEGKRLDRHFESDQRISPLESALSIWKLLEKEEGEPDKLHADIRLLIQIQAVAVHIEKGYFKEAREVLERLFPGSASNKSLRMKLALIINGKDPYLPFLQSFSYNLLMDKIKSYIDVFLKKNTTNFLIKAATKEVKTKRLGTKASQKKPGNIETNNESDLETEQRSRKRLFPLKQRFPWKQEKVPSDGVTKHRKTTTILQSLSDLQNIENCKKLRSLKQTGRKKQQWTWEDDQKLKTGVKKFGIGNWTKILIHYDFNNRTSVMLKDRWRTLVKQNIVSLDSEQ